MIYSFHPDAEKELTEAIAYYNECRKDLGLEFTKEVYLAVRNILSFPLEKEGEGNKVTLNSKSMRAGLVGEIMPVEMMIAEFPHFLIDA